MKKKSLIRRLLPWVLLLAVLGGTGYLGYLLWGRPESEALYTAEVIRRENENQEKVILDNGKLHLEMDPETTQFVLTDVYGHEWKSNPFADPAASGEKIASGANKNALASPLNVYYRLPKKAVDNMYDAYTYSISRSAYRIEKIDDNTLEVTYSLGDIATEFMVPESLIQERYSELSDAVKASGNNKQKFTGKYTGKKSADVLKNLESGDEAAKKEAGELISSYPQIAHQDIPADFLQIMFCQIIGACTETIGIHAHAGTQDIVGLFIRDRLILHDGQTVTEIHLRDPQIRGHRLISAFLFLFPVL